MPGLFIPLGFFLGVALVFGIASIVPSNNGTPERRQTDHEKIMGRISMIGWIASFTFAGALIASYIPPASF